VTRTSTPEKATETMDEVSESARHRVFDMALDRRTLLCSFGTGAVVLGAMALPACDTRAEDDPLVVPNARTDISRDNRVVESFRYRVGAATLAADRPVFTHRSNGEEEDYPGFIANYSKALPHDDLGLVDPRAYRSLLKALRTGRNSDFDKIELGLGRRLTSAQAGLAFDLEGCDSHHTDFPPAPRMDGPEHSGEAVELYWMALCRDVLFSDFSQSSLVAQAADDLNRLSDYRGRKTAERVSPATIFRGLEVGCEEGPFVSQFLYRDVPYGAQRILQRNVTALPGIDYMTDHTSWLNVQNGADPRGSDALDPIPRYLRNFRDLAAWVHKDALYQAYLNACLILFGMGAPFKPGIPSVVSRSCEGFVDWGQPHLLALICEVSTRALKVVWFHKWFVHRRMRPEAFGGLVHNYLTGAARYPIDGEVLSSAAVDAVRREHGAFFLPQAFPEGSPTHPSYGSGHATVAGACATILEAWFDESWVLPDPVEPNADGTVLLPYAGPSLTVGGELQKLAANIAIGRNAAGIHWLTDYYRSLRLGEYVAHTILEEQKASYNQSPTFQFTSFDGHEVTI
jgi:membrane-associated phospholipid phosphatase